MTFLKTFLIISLVPITIADFKYRKIPNRIILSQITVWFVCNLSYILQAIIPADFSADFYCLNMGNAMNTMVFVFIRIMTALFLVALQVCLVLFLSKLNRPVSYGGGDIKLIGVIGLYLGFFDTLYAVLTACIVFLLMTFTFEKLLNNLKMKPYPFGPALSFGTIFIMAMESLLK